MTPFFFSFLLSLLNFVACIKESSKNTSNYFFEEILYLENVSFSFVNFLIEIQYRPEENVFKPIDHLHTIN